MSRRFGWVLALWSVVCAAQTEPLLIRDWQIKDYWLPAETTPPVRFKRLPGACERATVTADFTVGADGIPRDIAITRNTPFSPFREREVRNALRTRLYVPAAANRDRQPVRASETFRFSC